MFFFNDTATTEIYTLSLHDALPISGLLQQRLGALDVPGLVLLGSGVLVLRLVVQPDAVVQHLGVGGELPDGLVDDLLRSEEHTSELQSCQYFVCRLLLV